MRQRIAAVARFLPGLTALVLIGSPAFAAGGPGPFANFIPPPPGATALTGSLDWRFSSIGTSVGAQGMAVRDLDGDGVAEIVATASLGGGYPYTYAWYVLGRDGAGYGMKWVSPTYSEPIGALIVANVDADPAPEVLVAVGSRVLVYDGASRVLERTLPGLRNGMKAMAVADVDNDGQLEIVSTDGTDLYFQDYATGNVEYRAIGLGGVALAVGNVAGNGNLEVVVANGTATGYVIGCKQRRVVWARPGGFGVRVAIGDVDRDGVNDIVSAFDYGQGLAVFDANAKVQKAGVGFSATAFVLADTDGDTWPEVIDAAYDPFGGLIEVRDGRTLAPVWQATVPYSITAVAWGNTDGDAAGEVAYGAYNHLGIVDGGTHLEDWGSLDVGGPYAVALADVDADGRGEIVSMSASAGAFPYGGRWLVHDVSTHALEFASNPVGDDAPPRLLVADVDGDPQPEVIVTSGDFPGHSIVCYDGLTHAEQWRRPLSTSFSTTQVVLSLAIGDVDGDGQLEVVAATRAGGSTFVFVLDAATGAVEWQSFDLGGYGDAMTVRIANLGGPRLAIVVRALGSQYSTTDGRLNVLDAVAHTASTVATPRLASLDTADLNGDGVAEVLGGTEDGRLVVLDPATGAVSRVIADYGQRVDGLAARELDGDGIVDYVFALADTVYVVSGADGHALWSSDPLDDGAPSIDVGREDGLVVTAPSATGRFKIAVTTGTSGFAVFKLR